MNIASKRLRQTLPDFESVGVKKWHAKGKLHRENGPAVEYPDGTCYWYQHGRKHRLDGPAVIFASGQKEWYVEGELQRLEMPDGSNYWYRSGRRHREDGPAIDCLDRKVWYLDGTPQAEHLYH